MTLRGLKPQSLEQWAEESVAVAKEFYSSERVVLIPIQQYPQTPAEIACDQAWELNMDRYKK